MRVTSRLGTLRNVAVVGGLLMLVTIRSALTAPIQNQNNPVIFVPNPMLPADVSSNCTVSSAMFASWFKSGSVTLNGEVNPANSVQFPNIPNCSFYQWSEQMFLWLTSPASAPYRGGAHIFESPAFYDVSPQDSNGKRTFVPHVSGIPIPAALRVAKPDQNGLPVVFDRAHVLREVVPAKRSRAGRPLVLNRAGAEVEVRSVQILRGGTPVFLDGAGRVIASPRPIIPAPLLSVSPTAQRAAAKMRVTSQAELLAATGPIQPFTIGATTVFLNTSGGTVELEQGQADHTVWQAKSGSLVYYSIVVNDMYAWFLTRQLNNNMVNPSGFPTTPTERNNIVAYAASHGKSSFPDANALAVEVKASWVELAGLPNGGSYITTKAKVPQYAYSVVNSNWVPNGTKTVTLALVGMHVVGSAFGHPEMIWATFEHTNNAPNAEYQYISGSGLKTVAQNTAGSWTFCCTNAAGPFNIPHLIAQGNTIVPQGNYTSSSDLLRQKAWGAGVGPAPNPVVSSAPESNSEIISVDRAVDVMLDPADKRRNYTMIGATWTKLGLRPDGLNDVGTRNLANTTMETSVQGSDNTALSGSSCFFCHKPQTSQFPFTAVSHIYKDLKPLF